MVAGASVLCAIALLGPTAAGASAEPPDPGAAKRKLDTSIGRLKDDLQETNKDLARAYTALESTQARLPSAQTALDTARSAATAADLADTAAAQQLAVAKAEEAKAEDELARTREAISDSRERVAQFASQIYQEQGFAELGLAVSAGSPQEFADRVALVGTVLDIQSRSVNRLATEKASRTAQESHLSAVRADSAAAKTKAAQALAAATTTRDQAASAKATLDGLVAAQSAQTAKLGAQKAAEKSRLSGMQTESARLAAVLRARALAARKAAGLRASSAPTSSRTGFLAPPTTAGWISSEFGKRYHPILHYWRLHAGRDYAAPCGTPVKAAAPGTVISAGWGGGYGNRVVLDHGIQRGVSLSSSYNHLQRIAVRGGTVARGQVIGYEGTTGMSNGCHIHFEVYQDGAPVDPRRWL